MIQAGVTLILTSMAMRQARLILPVLAIIMTVPLLGTPIITCRTLVLPAIPPIIIKQKPRIGMILQSLKKDALIPAWAAGAGPALPDRQLPTPLGMR
jgi:hypothetical protein